MGYRFCLLAIVCLSWAAAALAQAPQLATPGMGEAGAGPASCVRGEVCVLYDDPVHRGCGSRGGPGCRKSDGRCAAWRDGFLRDCRITPRGG